MAHPPRSKPFSQDLRSVLVYMRHHRNLTIDEIVTQTGLKKRTVYRFFEVLYKTGHIQPALARGGSRPKLSANDLMVLATTIQHTPDMYMDELMQQLEDLTGHAISKPTVWRALQKMGFTRKKISKVALERNEETRRQFVARIGLLYNAQQLVFVDESSFDRRTTYRGYAWSLKGQRAERKCFYVRGKRYSILPAISLNGILYCHIVEGSFNTERFKNFIESLLDHTQPYPNPNSVVVMDNCRIHKAPEIAELIESRGRKIEFLPAYSPDFNPIEQAFSSIKSYIRRRFPHFAQTNTTGTQPEDAIEVYTMLMEAVYSITPEQAHAFYHHSRYI